MTDWRYVIRQDTENWAGIWWRAGASSKPSVSVDLSAKQPRTCSVGNQTVLSSHSLWRI